MPEKRLKVNRHQLWWPLFTYVFLLKSKNHIKRKEFRLQQHFFSPKSLQKFAQFYLFSKLEKRLRSGTGWGFVSGRSSFKTHYFFRLLSNILSRLIHDRFSVVCHCVHFRPLFLVQFSSNSVAIFSVQLIALWLISNYDAFLVF